MSKLLPDILNKWKKEVERIESPTLSQEYHQMLKNEKIDFENEN